MWSYPVKRADGYGEGIGSIWQVEIPKCYGPLDVFGHGIRTVDDNQSGSDKSETSLRGDSCACAGRRAHSALRRLSQPVDCGRPDHGARDAADHATDENSSQE
jgi:hypothetical protein